MVDVGAHEQAAAPPIARPYLALCVVCFGLVMVTLDASILNIALPAMSRDLNASTSDLQWIVDSYTLTYACLVLTAGSLGDRFGRRRSFLWGVAGFGLSSSLACLATSAAVLIAARVLMGVTGAFMTPASLSIVTNLFHDKRERARAIAIWAAGASLGAAAGPVLGGLLLQQFWWGSVFLVNAPIAAALVIVIPFLVPETRDPHPNRVDPCGALLSMLAMSALLWATIAGPDHGWTSATIIGGFGTAMIALVMFVWWELRCSHPMLDIDFFRNPAFSAANVANIAVIAGVSGSLFMFAQLLQSVLGYGPLQAGIRLAPFAIIAAAAGLASVRLANIIGRKRAMVGGLLLEAAGAALFLFYNSSQGYVTAAVFFSLVILGQSIVYPHSIASVMESVPEEKAGVASGVSNTCRLLAFSLGVAIAGSVLSSSYRHGLRTRAASLGLDRGDVDEAGRSIATAVRTADKLGGAKGDGLLHAAREAFNPAVHGAMLVAVVICVVGAIASIAWLPNYSDRNGRDEH